MMKPFVQTKKGVSLVELLLYMAIMGILLTSIVSFISVNESMNKRNQAISEVDMQGWEIMRFLTQSIKNAQSVTQPVFGESSIALSLIVDDQVKNPTIFDVSSGVVRVKEGLSSPIALTNAQVIVSNLLFTNVGSDATKESIKIQFDISYFNMSDNTRYQKTMYGTATPR